MTEFTVMLAEIPVRIRPIHPEMADFLAQYRCEEEPAFTLEMSREDLERERRISAETHARKGESAPRSSDRYLETLAIYRKLAEELLERDVLLFHGSAVAVDGEAYLFTAPSGTGKSTHARLWREAFGDRAVMINDDKPLLRVSEEGVRVYGTPWNGKHRLGGNLSAPLKALCVLTRDERNHIEPISREEAFAVLFQQSYRPAREENLPRLLALLERLSRKVGLYRLGCNMEPEAAIISYQGMQEEKR